MNDLITRSFDAANAYGSTQKTMQNAFNMGGISGGSQPDVVTSFGDALTKALKDAKAVYANELSKGNGKTGFTFNK